MHPILFRIGPISIYSYGVMMAMAFLVGIYMATRQARRMGVKPEIILDLSVYIILGALVGAKLFYILLNLKEYIAHPLLIITSIRGGMVFYGGLLGAILASAWYLKRKRMPFWGVFDICAPSISLGQAIGRVGCFLNGCCYGRLSGLPWAVTFPHLPYARHPVQIYSAIACLFIFGTLLTISRHKRFGGEVFWFYVCLYSATRFGLEFFRGDPRGYVFFGFFSWAQLTGAIIFPLALIVLIIYRRHRASL